MWMGPRWTRPTSSPHLSHGMSSGQRSSMGSCWATDTSRTGCRGGHNGLLVSAHGGEDLVGGDAAVLAPGPLQAHALGAGGPAQIAVQAAPVGLELAGEPAAARALEEGAHPTTSSGGAWGNWSCSRSGRLDQMTSTPHFAPQPEPLPVGTITARSTRHQSAYSSPG